MNAYQPRMTPIYGYDSIYPSFLRSNAPIRGYDESPNCLTELEFDASPEGAANAQKFTGKERDSESGLDYFGARYYGSALGRFTSPDWSAKPQAIPYVNLADPQSLNLYSYVRNNPLGKVDSDGHCSAPSGLKSGQVGVCIDTYIQARAVRVAVPGAGLAFGDWPRPCFKQQKCDVSTGNPARNDTRRRRIVVKGLRLAFQFACCFGDASLGKVSN